MWVLQEGSGGWGWGVGKQRVLPQSEFIWGLHPACASFGSCVLSLAVARLNL